MSRHVAPEAVATAIRARRKGATLKAAAAEGGISVSTLRRHLEREEKPKPKRGPGRPPTPKEQLDAAVEAWEDGLPVPEAAAIGEVSPRVLYSTIKERGLTRGADAENDNGAEGFPELDENATPLETARALLEHTKRSIARLPKDSPRFNPAHANARAYVKLIATLEREEAGDETPEQAEERKRQEDGLTRKMIERYVVEYEAAAAREGVCLWCKKPLEEGTHIALAEVAALFEALEAWAASVNGELEGRERAVWDAWAGVREAYMQVPEPT